MKINQTHVVLDLACPDMLCCESPPPQPATKLAKTGDPGLYYFTFGVIPGMPWSLPRCMLRAIRSTPPSVLLECLNSVSNCLVMAEPGTLAGSETTPRNRSPTPYWNTRCGSLVMLENLKKIQQRKFTKC